MVNRLATHAHQRVPQHPRCHGQQSEVKMRLYSRLSQDRQALIIPRRLATLSSTFISQQNKKIHARLLLGWRGV
ncbi:hypothetical protein OEZ85_003800 [Tetradesmus obliquus]|uniref:Uncharacterized protein n=1 Tax=Tetradesmus obliquus TaxID=3088 RepID=A0ABY8UD12_TETOB|nr:hypothetical protein OEZ85_003800 [Tetradesmus obliquus]